MQGKQSLWRKFRRRDSEGAGSSIEISQAEAQHLGPPQASHREKSDQRLVRERSKRRKDGLEVTGGKHEPPDLSVRIDMRLDSAGRRTEQTVRWHFGARIIRVAKPREIANQREPFGVVLRGSLDPGCPSHSEVGRDRLSFRVVIGKAAEIK